MEEHGKFLVLAPPLTVAFGDMKKKGFAAGPHSIVSYLHRRGVEVGIVDCYGAGFDNLRGEGEFTQTWGLSDSQILAEVKNFFGPNGPGKVGVIGINAFAAVYHQDIIYLAKLLKSEFPEALIVAGGSHATLMPEFLLRGAQGSIDYIALNEGEVAIAGIMDSLKSNDSLSIKKIPGLAYLENGQLIRTGRAMKLDTDEKLDLDFSLISKVPFTNEPTHAYSSGGRRWIDVSLTFGCDGRMDDMGKKKRCPWCVSPIVNGGLRIPSLAAVQKLVDNLANAGFSHVIFQDDSLARTPIEFLSAALKMFHSRGITWQDNGGMEIEVLYDNPALIKLFAETGCTNLFLPCNFKRTDITVDRIPEDQFNDYRSLLTRLNQNGISVYPSFMIGTPGTPVSVEAQAIEFLASLVREGISYNTIVYAYKPFPSTKTFNESYTRDGMGGFVQKEGAVLNFPLGMEVGPSWSFNYPGIEVVRGDNAYPYYELFDRFFKAILDSNCGIQKALQLTDGAWNGKEYKTEKEAFEAAQKRLAPRDIGPSGKDVRTFRNIPVRVEGENKELRIPAPTKLRR